MYTCIYIYIYIYIWKHVYMYIYIFYICVCIYIYIYVYIHIYVCIYMYMYIHIYIYVYKYIYVYFTESLSLSLFMCICISMYIHMYMYTYIYIGWLKLRKCAKHIYTQIQIRTRVQTCELWTHTTQTRTHIPTLHIKRRVMILQLDQHWHTSEHNPRRYTVDVRVRRFHHAQNERFKYG